HRTSRWSAWFKPFKSFKSFNPLLHPPPRRGGGKRRGLERSAAIERLERFERKLLSRDALEESFLFQLVQGALIDIPRRIHIDLGIALRHHLESVADALGRDAGREGKARGDVLIGFLDRLGIFLLQPLAQHRRGLLLVVEQL